LLKKFILKLINHQNKKKRKKYPPIVRSMMVNS